MSDSVQTNMKYDARKWKKIMDTTQSNYANMITRLSRKRGVSNFVLVYYSIFLIINTLTGKYFPDLFNSVLAEYFGIILSVVMLAYSLINSSSNYEVRISNIETGLNKLKTIKRELSDDNLQDCIDKYNKLTDGIERRQDVDFYITVKHLCKEYEISLLTKKRKKNSTKKESIAEDEYNNQETVVKNYISEINVVVEQGKILFTYIWTIILVLVPIIIFVICILASSRAGIKISFLYNLPIK